MEPHTGTICTGLAALQLDRTATCYRLGPGSSERMAVLPPGHMLGEIDRIEINRFIERQGVTYYVLEVFTAHARKKAARASATQLVHIQLPHAEDDDSSDVLIDVELNAVPDHTLERRYSEFEALRHALSVSFETLHEGDCTYCDTFLRFLSSSSVQPGLLTKLTTRPPQRKGILCAFINRTIRLALQRVDREVEGAPAHCNGWSIIPQVVENFLRTPRVSSATD